MKRKLKLNHDFWFLKSVGYIFVVLIQSCSNVSDYPQDLNTTTPVVASNTTGSYSHAVRNATVLSQPGTNGSAGQIELALSTDSSVAGYQSLTTFCSLEGAQRCQCRLSWTEVNVLSGNQSVSRTRNLAAIEIQSALVRCRMAQSFWDEIPSGTTISMQIVPSSNNLTGLNTRPVNYKKGTQTTANGDFLDDTLTPFRNILRYSCFSKRRIQHEIPNATMMYGDTNPKSIPIGSRFCINNSESSGGSFQCATARNGFSVQSYYRNLFIRSDNLGSINSTNDYYDCPRVRESVRYSPGQSIPLAEQGKYYPLDSQFALATQYSPEWSVGVRAPSILFKANDPNSSTGVACRDGTEVGSIMTERGIVNTCLGYAKRARVDGTCGSINDQNGRVRYLVRLRRFRAVYPSQYLASGKPEQNNLEGDEVYVPDRLVVDQTGVPTGDMIFGPKPCHFAWFDREGVVTRGGTDDYRTNFKDGVPAYVSTQNYSLGTQKVNPDGLIYPNFDRSSSEGMSCAATLPVVTEVNGRPEKVSLLTTYKDRRDTMTINGRQFPLKEIHLKTIEPFVPRYVEDQEFKACVPIADPFVEPPLEVYRSNGGSDYAWCSKVYPNHNPYWVELNAKRKGISGTATADILVKTTPEVSGRTSQISSLHATSSCVGMTDVQMDSFTGVSRAGNVLLTQLYPSPATGYCDRTVVYDQNQDFRGFPLTANQSDLRTHLSADLSKRDSAYSCRYSVSSLRARVGKLTPSSGCCGVVSGNPFLTGLNTNSSVHIEPYTPSGVPDVRFCGNPVQ